MIVNKKDKIKLKLIDTCGQEKYRSLTKSYIKNADAVLFVFSKNDKESFYSITEWIKLLDENICKKNIIKYLVGNNIELKPEIEDNLIDKFAKENNMPYMKISGNKKINIDNLFEDLGKKLYLKYINSKISSIKLLGNSNKKKLHKLPFEYYHLSKYINY